MLFWLICAVWTMGTLASEPNMYVPLTQVAMPQAVDGGEHPSASQEMLDLHARMKREDTSLPASAVPTTVDLNYYHSQLVTGDIYVGTPVRKYTVQFNIYSTDCWLIYLNSSVYEATGFQLKSRYFHNESTTYQNTTKPFSTDFEYVKGFFAKDIMQVGTTFTKTTFGVADDAGYWISYEPIDGVLGLSPAPTADGSLSTIQQIMANVEPPIITAYLNKSKTYNENGTGLLTIGGEDQTNCDGPYVYAEYSNPPTWQIAAFAVSDAHNNTVQLRNLSITVSDWGSWLVASKEVITLIANAAGATYNGTSNNWEVGCDKINSEERIYFAIRKDGSSISTTVGDLVQMYDGKCIVAIYASYENEDCNWYFPASFVRTHCIAVNYRNNTMGFSEIKASLRPTVVSAGGKS